MANNFKTMLQIKRILQLLSKDKNVVQISKELGISVNTIKKYKCIFENSGLSYPELLEIDQQKFAMLINPKTEEREKSARLQTLTTLLPNYINRLQNSHITRELLWQQYIKQHTDGYGYSQFCEHISQNMLQSNAVMHLVHEPGDVLQIDFAGDKLSYILPFEEKIIYCPVLVCTMPYSSFCYVEALPNMSQLHLIGALNRCMEYLGGVPHNICSDNLKQIVNKADKYEPTFSVLMDQFALHYNVCLTATRVVKPRDKASVERHVGISYSRIYAHLEQQKFYSLSELNNALREHLEILNDAPMQKKPNSRRQCFMQKEQPYLLPLPNEPFEIKYETRAKVQQNYHVILGEDWHNYSVPYQYIGKQVKIIYDSLHVEIYLNLKRIALHSRDYVKNGFTTQPDHCPKNHQTAMLIQSYTPADLLNKAKLIGDSTHKLISSIIESNFFSQQIFKSCLGILRLGDIQGKERLEKACSLALKGSCLNYRTVKNIIDNNRDKLDEIRPIEPLTYNTHSNIRGEDFFADIVLN
jgi:transposase